VRVKNASGFPVIRMLHRSQLNGHQDAVLDEPIRFRPK
jgi:hypothetical protein